jgi:hypothetical protein
MTGQCQVFLNEPLGRHMHRHEADFVALALDAEVQHALTALDIPDPEPAELLAAEAVIEQGGEDGAIAHALEGVLGRRIEQLAGLGIEGGVGLVADQEGDRLPVHRLLVAQGGLVGADRHAGLAGALGPLRLGGDAREMAGEGGGGLLGQVAPWHQHQGAAAEGGRQGEEHDRLAGAGRGVHPGAGGAVVEAAGELVEGLDLVLAQDDVGPGVAPVRQRPRQGLAGAASGARFSGGVHSVGHPVPASGARTTAARPLTGA